MIQRKHAWFLATAMACGAVFGLGACSGDEPAKPRPTTSVATTARLHVKPLAVVRLIDGLFVPEKISIQPGDNVRFVNVDGGEYSVLPDEEGAFAPIEAEQFSAKGASVVVSFEDAGSFGYHSASSETEGEPPSGTVEVKAAATSGASGSGSATTDAATSTSTGE